MTASLRIGVIGTGNFGERHVASYARRPDVDLVGVVDRDADRAQSVAARWGIPHWFTDSEDLLRTCRPNGVSVVTSGRNHLQPSLAALAGDCSVLLEKPITLSTRDADELVDAERRSTAFVIPAHILRFSAPYQELVTRVRSGQIGRVIGIATVRDRGRDHAQLFADVHPALMTAIHDIDLALWITGARAVRVTAQGRGEKVDEMPRLVWAQVEASDGSVWALRVSWLLSDDAPGSDKLEVYGTAGVATLHLRPTVALFTESSTWVDHELTPDAHYPGALDHEIDHFCALLRSNDRTPAVTLEEARHGIEIAEAMMRSIENSGALTELGG